MENAQDAIGLVVMLVVVCTFVCAFVYLVYWIGRGMVIDALVDKKAPPEVQQRQQKDAEELFERSWAIPMFPGYPGASGLD